MLSFSCETGQLASFSQENGRPVGRGVGVLLAPGVFLYGRLSQVCAGGCAACQGVGCMRGVVVFVLWCP